MAWSKTSSRLKPLPPDWWKRRGKQLKADGYRCTHIREDTGTRCTERATHVDHVNGVHDEDELTSLCQWHHMSKTGRDAAKFRRKPAERHRHPGIG